MTIRAKFYVGKVDQPEGCTAAQVHLGAVCRGIENSMWAQYTPAGSLQMSIKNDLATEQFKVGDEWELLLRKVAKPMQGDGHPIIRAVTPKGEVVCETCGHSLAWTEEAVKTYGDHMRQYMTPEYEAEKAAAHEEFYGTA